MTRTVVLVLIAAFATAGAMAQASINPDMSVIPRFRIDTNDGGQLPEQRVWSRPDLSFEELEIAIQSYLNPYAKADVILTIPGPDVENAKLGIEEVYATIVRGLPLDLNLRFGKYRAGFGKINMTHPHAWPFITQPLSQERFLGEEGLNDLGISASVLLPTGDVYTSLTADLLRGEAIGSVTGMPDSTGGSLPYAGLMRLQSFFPLTDNADMELGLSGYTGIHDPYRHERFWYVNVDLKYKYRPSSYTALVVQGEYLYNTRTVVQDFDGNDAPEERRLHTGGVYVFADLQFLKIFSIGARYDWSQTPYSADDRAHAVSLFAGYYPVEETLGVRLQYQRTTNETPGIASTVNQLALQVLFSLGPHKAHPF
jgi:hypothetical protein